MQAKQILPDFVRASPTELAETTSRVSATNRSQKVSQTPYLYCCEVKELLCLLDHITELNCE